MSTLRLTLVCLIMSYAPGFAVAAGREGANSVEGKKEVKNEGFVAVLIVLDSPVWPPSFLPHFNFFFFPFFVSPGTSLCS